MILPNEILNQHKLRSTPIREQVLKIFLAANKAITAQDIEQSFGQELDRVTLYRTIQKFLEHGIIHQIEDQGQVFYASCENCEIHEHDDNHLHFKCNNCETIKCLHQHESLEFAIPKGYKVASMKILLEGTCSNCV